MLIVDSRESSKNQEILNDLKSKLGIDNVGVEKLNLGDYLILSDPPCLVERMTSNEIISRRKMEQVKGMVKDNPNMRPFVLFEGSISKIFLWRDIHPNAVFGKLLGIIHGWDVPMMFSTGRNQTVLWLSNLYRRATSEGESKPYVRPSARRGWSFEDQQLWTVSAVPGFGGKLAERLLDHFGNPRAVYNADVDELMKVPGVGKKKAARFVAIATGKKVES